MTDFVSNVCRTTKQRLLLGCLMGALAVQGCGDDDDNVEPGVDAGPGDAGGPSEDGSPGDDAGPAPVDASQGDGGGDGDGIDAGDGGGDGSDLDGGIDAGDAADAGQDAGEVDASVPLQNGLRGDYYRGTSFITYAGSRIDPTVNFEYPPETPPIQFQGQADFPHTWYSVRWLGYIEPAVTATYKFWVSADDGQRLWIDGVKILDGWTQGAANAEESSTVELQAGVRYPIRLDTFQHYNIAVARLEWESTDGVVAREIVPTERLFALPLDQRPPTFLTFEAESETNSATGGSAVHPVDRPIPRTESCDNCSNFTRALLKVAPDNGSVTFNLEGIEAGKYLLQIWYANKGLQGQDRYVLPSKGTMSINGGPEQEVLYPNNFNDTSVWDSVDFEVTLLLGANTIRLSGLSAGFGDTKLDRISLRRID